MKLVALGGGIGSGKSTVSSQLGHLGAVIIDADLVAREVVVPGGLAYGDLVARFGTAVLLPDGTLNRPALAEIVFNSADELAALNAITHPAIVTTMQERALQQVDTDRVVVIDAALDFETPKVELVGRMVVDVDAEIAVKRLMAYRGFSEDDARARIRSQISREQRVAKADFVIKNSGTPEDLLVEIDRAWAWITTLPDSKPLP